MITEAIYEDKKWTKGSSRIDIRKFIEMNYDVDEDKLKANLSSNLNKMLDVGSSGYACLKKEDQNYKMTAEWRKQWKKNAGIRPQKRKKKKKEPGAPKNTRNSYLWYLQDVRENLKDKYPDKNHREITLLIADNWNHLPPKKKKKYEDKAAADKERYEREKKEWEKKKKRKRRETSEESSSESRSKGSSKKKKRRYDSESESKSGGSKSGSKRSKKKTSDSESSGDKKKRRKEESSSEEKKADSNKKDEDKSKK
jgi:hypothetical protein